MKYLEIITHCHKITMRFHEISMEFHEIIIDSHDNFMRFYGISWDYHEVSRPFHQISKKFKLFLSQFGSSKYWQQDFRLLTGNIIQTTKFDIKNNADSCYLRLLMITFHLSKVPKRSLAVHFLSRTPWIA